MSRAAIRSPHSPLPVAPFGLPLIVPYLLLSLSLVVPGSPVAADDEATSVSLAGPGWPALAAATRGLERREGFLDLWLDTERGKVFLELPAKPEEEDSGALPGILLRLLWQESLTSGFGSNPVGLDRGQLGSTRVAHFRRVGGTVLFTVESAAYRADTERLQERRAVAESFAGSTLWAGPIVAVGEGRVLVEITPLLVSDVHRVGPRLAGQEEGEFQVDAARSAVDARDVLVFPDNVEIDAVITWQGKKPGEQVRATAPVAETFTLTQHHSFIRLPVSGFTPRAYDPRGGFFTVRHQDYAAPLDEPLEVLRIARFRLEKTDPRASSSPVVEPIVFHVDLGTPEPVRSALVDGASWWGEAFAAAGFEDAYRVELLPPDAHPLDVRYNVIQWVHRSTRGWSYGGGVIDPRTGEILKGHVNLGSLRVRQDRRIFEGLLGTAATGTGAANDPVELALARIRQLAAHEVGHALGLDHNFAASTYGRASVMDYPAPWVKPAADGGLDVSEAYAVGVGAWDRHAIEWGYSQFPPGAGIDAELRRHLDEGVEAGLIFLPDSDARDPATAHPLANLWDNGADPVAELGSVLEVRRRALAGFDADHLPADQPLGLLHEVLVPVYLYHRYQLEAAMKSVGGLEYLHELAGNGVEGVHPLAAAEQRRALTAVLAALSPVALDLPESILALLPPRPPEHPRHRELFDGRAEPAFDPLAAAAVAADLVVRGLLDPRRAARLVDQRRRDPRQLSFDEVLERLEDTAFDAPVDGSTDAVAAEAGRLSEVRRTIQTVAVSRLVELAGHGQASPAVRARAAGALRGLLTRLMPAPGEDASAERVAHRAFLSGEIERFLTRPAAAVEAPPAAPEAPPGSPIGMGPQFAIGERLGACGGFGD